MTRNFQSDVENGHRTAIQPEMGLQVGDQLSDDSNSSLINEEKMRDGRIVQGQE